MVMNLFSCKCTVYGLKRQSLFPFNWWCWELLIHTLQTTNPTASDLSCPLASVSRLVSQETQDDTGLKVWTKKIKFVLKKNKWSTIISWPSAHEQGPPSPAQYEHPASAVWYTRKVCKRHHEKDSLCLAVFGGNTQSLKVYLKDQKQ